MRSVIQRVKSASVSINGNVFSQINKGILIFVAIHQNDKTEDIDYTINKCLNLRIFENEDGLFDKSITDTNYEVLIVSQFTLYGDTRKGRRPSFSRSMDVKNAKEFYDLFVEKFTKSYSNIKCGQFQSMMEVSLINDGPVTIIVDSNKDFY